MGRKKTSRKRLGKTNEVPLLGTIRKLISTFPLSMARSAEIEVTFNAELLAHLRKGGVDIQNKDIHDVTFLGETFRPEGHVKLATERPLCCIECKRANNDTLKNVWKEGLAQSMLYAVEYKYVFFVIYDFTTDGIAAKAFGPGNKAESSLRAGLRDKHNIEIVVIRAT